MKKKTGDRGSKSKALISENAIVKEQRVDGSWLNVNNNYFCLRYTLAGFEKSYPLGVVSLQKKVEISSQNPFLSNK